MCCWGQKKQSHHGSCQSRMTSKFKKKHCPICYRTTEGQLQSSRVHCPCKSHRDASPAPVWAPGRSHFFLCIFRACLYAVHTVGRQFTAADVTDDSGWERCAQQMRPQREEVSCRQNLHICQASLSHSPPLIFITKSYAASATPGLFQIL